MPIKLLESNQQIEAKIKAVVLKKLTTSFGRVPKVLNGFVRRFVRESIESTPVWQSLKSGDLRGEFGIPAEENTVRLNNILNTWLKEISAEVKIISNSANQFTVSYRLMAIQADWANVLSLEDGVTINTPKPGSGARQRIPWLEWILTNGNDANIAGFDVLFGSFPRSRSRSTIAIMIPSQISWKIPLSVGAATSDNNFVTRSLDRLATDFKFRKSILDAVRQDIRISL